MLAELHGKLDPTSLDPVERSEDLLTSAVFGAVRHLPRVGVLRPLLGLFDIYPSQRDLERAEVLLWPNMPIGLWPGAWIEPDVIILAGRHVVVFEAKLYSQFGWYTKLNGDQPGPRMHQLGVQYIAVERWAAGAGRDAPVVVAVTPAGRLSDSDRSSAVETLKAVAPEADHEAVIKWASWRHIGEVLDKAKGLRVHERRLVDDVLAFMEKRGVRRMFTGFRREDYWLISAAQRVAADRLYPEIRTFLEDLLAVLQEEAITWAWNWKGIWTSSGVALAKPNDWTRSYVGAQFWPTSWPRRSKAGNSLALYAAFNFLDPALEVGLAIPGPGVGVAQDRWGPFSDAVASELANLPAHYELVLDAGDIARPARVSPASAVDSIWMTGATASATSTAHLRVRTSVDPFALTVDQAREAVVAMRDALEPCTALWAMLRSTEYFVDEEPPPQEL